MSNPVDEPHDSDIPQLALNALAAAQNRALASGRVVVLIQGNELVEISSSGRRVIKRVPGRFLATTRTKSAKP